MPSYDYSCDKCHEIFELEHSMQETFDYTVCGNRQDLGNGDFTECEGYLHKVFRPAATHFKGQGWGKVYRIHKGKDIT